MNAKQKRGTFRNKCRFFVCFLVLILLLQNTPVYAATDTEIYRSVKTDSKQIAITFDDGPHPHLTERILEILDRYNAKATFFMVGCNVVNYPNVARQVIQKGHEIGNHTFTHAIPTRMDENHISKELEDCEDALEELCEYRPHLFRPPEGAINSFVQHCADMGDYRLILWSIDTRDWETKNAEQIAQCVLSKIQPGDIILMHDYIGRHSKTPEALEILLPKLIENGYEPVTVSRLLGLS